MVDKKYSTKKSSDTGLKGPRKSEEFSYLESKIIIDSR